MMVLGLAFIFTGAIAIAAYKACSSTFCKVAEEIFQLLGMKHIATVNLNKITKKHEKELISNKEWHDPSDKNRADCPSSKFIYSGEWWFYY